MERNNIIRRVFVKILNEYYKIIFKHKVLKTPKVTLDIDSGVVVCMLSSHNNLIESIACLKSFYRFCDKKFPLHYHDDGTLTLKDIKTLKFHFINVKIISFYRATEEVNHYLKNNNFLECYQLRNAKILYSRLFDFHYFSEGKQILQLDSDLLFFQKPVELLKSLENNLSVYNLDRGPAYSYSYSTIENYIQRKMAYHFNAGLVSYKSNINESSKFINDFLKTKPVSERDWVLDQTMLAMYLSTKGCQPLSRKYDLAYHYVIDFNNNEFGDVVSQHYCAWARNMHKIDFITKVYPFLKETNAVNNHYFKIIEGSLIP